MIPEDGRVQITQEQIFHGARELRVSGLLKDNADPTSLMIAVSRIYTAMRRIEPERVPSKELFIIGAKR